MKCKFMQGTGDLLLGAKKTAQGRSNRLGLAASIQKQEG